jgi:hypothetical protein
VNQLAPAPLPSSQVREWQAGFRIVALLSMSRLYAASYTAPQWQLPTGAV